MGNGYVLMVVDDEQIIREGIASQHDWSAEGIDEIIKVSNGIDALRILKEKRPDIIITDVRMPQMTGLEFAKQVFELDSSIMIIILSGYDDFAYAQEAIKFHVVDYLLKPCSKAAIVSAVKKAIVSIGSERSKKQKAQELAAGIHKSLPLFRERFLNRIILNPYLDEKELLGEYDFVKIGLASRNLCVIVFKLDEDSISPAWHDSGGRQLLKFAIVNVLGELAEKSAGVAIENALGFFTVFLSGIDGANGFHAKNAIFKFVRTCIRTIAHNLNVKIYAGIGSVVENLMLASASYKEAVLASECVYVLDAEFVDIEDIFKSRDLNGKFPIGYEEKIFHRVLSGDTEYVETEVDNYIKDAVKYNLCSLEYLKSFFCGVFFYVEYSLLELDLDVGGTTPDKKNLFEIIQSCNSVKDISENIKKLLRHITEAVGSVRRDKNHMVILDAKQYISEHLDDRNLSLESIAKAVSFSPNYFSYLFKQTVGAKPSEYITLQRMEQARKMLETPNIQVNKVSHMVGYSDQRYFSRLFKKYYGLLPTEYAKNYLKKVDESDADV